MRLKLTESDLNIIIKKTINKLVESVINENQDNELLGKIAERITQVQDNIDWSQERGEIEVPLDDNGDLIAYVDYEIANNQYSVPGMKGVDSYVPDDDPIRKGEANVTVTDIVLYDENNEEYHIEDTGIVSNLLQTLIDPTQLEAPMLDNEF